MEQGGSKGEQRNITQVKLPKLNMIRFEGDPKDWMSFWDSFEGSVHTRRDLSDRDKFDYLRGLLDKEPKDLIKNHEMDSANYKAAIQLLKERYGDRERISRIHYNALMNIKPVFKDYEHENLKRFNIEVETNHRALIS